MRIAILTFHRAYNCGAMLQAWALGTILTRMGHIVEFPICNRVGESARFEHPRTWRQGIWLFVRSVCYRMCRNLLSLGFADIQRARYRRFRTTFLHECACLPKDFPSRYDCVIVGSDQVWNPAITNSWLGLFLGETIPCAVPMIAYAASYGDSPLTPKMLYRVAHAAKNRFSVVSVREITAARQLAEVGVALAPVVADPTLLLTARDYEAIRAPFRTRGKVLYAYVLEVSHALVVNIQALARKLGARPIITQAYAFTCLGKPRNITYGLSPDRLVAYVAQADYTFMASFHGTVFSILFRKPFLSWRSEENPDYPSRPGLLLRDLGLQDRLLTPARGLSLDEQADLLATPIPDTVYEERLPRLRREGLAFLNAALAGTCVGGGNTRRSC